MPKTIWSLPKKDRLHIMILMLPTNNQYLFRRCKKVYLENVEAFDLPKSWIVDSKKLCDLFNVDFEYGYGRPYSAYYHNYDSDGNKLERPLVVINIDDNYSITEFIITLSHELSHAIQYKLYVDPIKIIKGFDKKLSARLEFEQEAGRLSYYVYKQYFAHLMDLHHNKFKSYYSKYEKKFLYNDVKILGIKNDTGIDLGE